MNRHEQQTRDLTVSSLRSVSGKQANLSGSQWHLVLESDKVLPRWEDDEDTPSREDVGVREASTLDEGVGVILEATARGSGLERPDCSPERGVFVPDLNALL